MPAFLRVACLRQLSLMGPRARSRRLLQLGAGLCTTLWASSLLAQQPTLPRVTFNGFGTLGLATSSEREADYIAGITQGEGPGHSQRVSPNLDSRLAGQLSLRLSHRLSAVVQVVAEQTGRQPFAPTLEWANLRFAVTPDLNIRAGRIVAPIFLVSEYRKVSFASAWERPPVELYGMIPISAADGVDINYQHVRDGWTGRLNVFYGRTAAETPSGTVEGERAWDVNTVLQHGAFTGRIAVVGGRLSATALTPLFTGLRSLGPAGAVVADRFDVNKHRVTFGTVGTEYDPGRWFAMAELAGLSSRSLTGTQGSGYVHAGLRWRALTPFATYAHSVLLSADSVAGVDLAALPAALAPVGGALNAALNGFLRTAPAQQSLAFGLRWDVRAGLALKGQLDAIDVGKRSTGTFTNFQPGFRAGNRVYVASLSTVFVF